jgi:glycerophosphoryl diester phosphodiesterase
MEATEAPLFVYGTLRPALAPSAIAAVVGTLRSLGPARVRGRLYDLGRYPAAIADPGEEGWIEGELVVLGPESPPLAWFDAYEGWDPAAPASALFRRERVEAVDGAGRAVSCWMWSYARALGGARRIDGWGVTAPARAAAAAARRVIGFAHRGGMAHAPENTLDAFALALARGADGLESDVWITADGVAVLHHDEEVRCGDALRPIASLPRAALPESVPTLPELYAIGADAVELSLDVKDPAAAAAAVAAARAAGAEERLWLCHWNWRTVAGFRALSPAVRLVDSTRAAHMRTPPALRARRMAELGLDAINLHAGDWRAEWIEIFHREGRLALAWDTQDDATAARLLAMGADGIFGDDVDCLLRTIRALDD